MAEEKLDDFDLYAILDLQLTASESEIKRAYRKKALLCHPDKNPNDPKAAETFHKLSRALEILTDVSSRAVYDSALQERKSANSRHLKLEKKRRKQEKNRKRRCRENFDDELNSFNLERRLIELTAMAGNDPISEDLKLFIDETMNNIHMIDPNRETSRNRIRIKWKVQKGDINNGGYNCEILRNFLKKYGDIAKLFISTSKKGHAVVEFATREASEMAVQNEKGLPYNPLKLKFVNED